MYFVCILCVGYSQCTHGPSHWMWHAEYGTYSVEMVIAFYLELQSVSCHSMCSITKSLLSLCLNMSPLSYVVILSFSFCFPRCLATVPD